MEVVAGLMNGTFLLGAMPVDRCERAWMLFFFWQLCASSSSSRPLLASSILPVSTRGFSCRRAVIDSDAPCS
jgi:hypothetical protein